MRLTANFTSEEFDRGGSWLGTIDQRLQLAILAQWLRDLAGTPGTITSASRSPAHNAKVGGTESSQHMRAEAIDIVFRLTPLRTLASRVLSSIAAGDAPRFGQIIFYTDKGHVHLSLPTLGNRNGEVRYSNGDDDGDGDRDYPFLTSASQLPALSGDQTRGSLRPAAPPAVAGVADPAKVRNA